MNTKNTVFRDVTTRTLRRNLSAFRKQLISDAPTLLTTTSSIKGPHTKSVVAYTLEPKVSADRLRTEPKLSADRVRTEPKVSADRLRTEPTLVCFNLRKIL
jgi:hypothetical protein